MTASLQPWEIVDLPLHRLLAAGRKIEKSSCQSRVRLAVLGDAATQHYCQALEAVLKLRGVWPQTYEAEFDMIRQEVLDAGSGLYRSEPQFVLLFMTVQGLQSRYVACRDKSNFATEVVTDLKQLWEAFRTKSSAILIQHNFAIPFDLPYGNQTILQPQTFTSAVLRINAGLAEAARERGIRIVDTEFQSALYGKRVWFDERLWCQARQALSPSFLPPLAKSVSDTLLAEVGNMVKCVVVDLDNTMWGGVLGDDGLDGIEIGQTEVGLVFLRFQQALAELKARGILLAIQSKNRRESVLDALDNHPDMVLRSKDFVEIVANYDDKVSGILAIQKALNLGLDNFVFLDDSAFERGMVREALPDIVVPELPDDPAAVLGELARWGLFEGRAATKEDLVRLELYQANKARDELKASYGGVDDYLAGLNMEAEIRGLDSYTLPRVLQLVQRSNQFNLTTIRYGETELEAIARDPDNAILTVRLADRFGDNGIVAVLILRKRGLDLLVDTWIMSCRVLARRVEEFSLDLIVNRARDLGCARVLGKYAATAKNGLVADLYPRLGFELLKEEGSEKLFGLALEKYSALPIPIRSLRFQPA